MFTALTVLFLLSCAAITAFLAGQRGKDVMGWYLAGLVLGPFGWLVSVLPSEAHEPEAMFGE